MFLKAVEKIALKKLSHQRKNGKGFFCEILSSHADRWICNKPNPNPNHFRNRLFWPNDESVAANVARKSTSVEAKQWIKNRNIWKSKILELKIEIGGFLRGQRKRCSEGGKRARIVAANVPLESTSAAPQQRIACSSGDGRSTAGNWWVFNFHLWCWNSSFVGCDLLSCGFEIFSGGDWWVCRQQFKRAKFSASNWSVLRFFRFPLRMTMDLPLDVSNPLWLCWKPICSFKRFLVLKSLLVLSWLHLLYAFCGEIWLYLKYRFVVGCVLFLLLGAKTLLQRKSYEQKLYVKCSQIL